MADYYPLIARAIAGLDPSAPGEARRALYERARTALIAQLRGVQPPLSESEITRERLALEEAVRKVESEAAQRARAPKSSAPPPPEPPPGPAMPPMPETLQARPRAGDAFRASPRGPRPEAAPQRPPRDRAAPRPPPGQDDRQGADRQGGDRQRPLRPEPPRSPQRPQPPNDPRARGGNRPGLEGFRDVMADADDLGAAAAQANRAARKAFSKVPSPSAEFDRMEPDLENRGGPQGQPYSYDESSEEAARYQGPSAQQPQRPPPPGTAKAKRSAPRFPVMGAIVVGLALVIAGLAIWQGPKVIRFVRGMLKSSPAVVQTVPDPNAPAGPRPKIPDRVGQPGSNQIAPVAQKVVLYDEDPAEPQGKQYVGTVIWRTEQVKAGNATDLAVRADIDIPERKFKMTLTIRRNSDASLPASHTAELTFVLPADFQGGTVANVPGVLMKSNEQARGTPLAGLAVKVTEGFFLVGLSNAEADRARNIQLLKERSWFDVPLVYSSQRRAIVAIEKGAPGERAFNEAFSAWGQ